MAFFDTSLTRSSTSGIGQVFASILGYAIAWNEARETQNALGKLSDRELDDIGLSRADLGRMFDRS